MSARTLGFLIVAGLAIWLVIALLLLRLAADA